MSGAHRPGAVTTPPPEPVIMQALKKVCKLSGRKQQKILEFIEVITAKRPPAENWD
ncbi:hypothetical protein GCM10011328_34990 [Hafnia psychrotolerans]|uniref:Uncharacterized protein n=1 Tax=Hafnia psychrotolerans TaxID=1477018 RepID=A0ABQ1H2G9_9GAMM|nr:hypothetical protein GCM10011328_34990 [Hafnia psychrotolerans]